MGRIRESILPELRLNRKIQLLILLIVIPLCLIFLLMFFNVYRYNRQYDRVIANASEAGHFSIKFKEDFDYKVYLIIAGHSTFKEDELFNSIASARTVAKDLVRNASLDENKRRAESILKLLGNLDKYVNRIIGNKRVGGHYDDNFHIWENDVQIVTSLIQSNVLEYGYYEIQSMEQMRKQVSSSLDRTIPVSLVSLAALAAIAVLLSAVISNSIVRPIRHLSHVTDRVAEGDLTVRADVLGSPEVRKLGSSLNSMIEEIDSLLVAAVRDEKNLREIELELLQSQINPHFLYNTLETIMWLSEAGKQDKVVEIVSALSDFFRTSLSQGSGMVTLQQEERHVRSYLQIQQVRYRDILEYEIHIPDELFDVILPKMTLQPLVENALYHGIKNKRGLGRINIFAEDADDSVLVHITDNGIGMTPERLDELQQLLAGKQNTDADRKFFGLYNVNERIRLKFGQAYGISIMSTYGDGTMVTVKLPYPYAIENNSTENEK